jgi:hypothetical protein
MVRRIAINELEELKKRLPDPEYKDEVRLAWDKEEVAAFTKPPSTQRAMETGEDMRNLLTLVENRQETEDGE